MTTDDRSTMPTLDQLGPIDTGGPRLEVEDRGGVVVRSSSRDAEDRVMQELGLPVPRRVDQTIFFDDPKRVGNCYAACVATWFGVPLEDVPHFVELGIQITEDEKDHVSWWSLSLGFFAARGYWPTRLQYLDDAHPLELVFVGGPSPRGVEHAVLYRGGELWHDPHPSRDGLLSIDDDDLIVWRPRSDFDHSPTHQEDR